MSAGSSAAQQAQRLSAIAQSYRRDAERVAVESGQNAAATIAEPLLSITTTPTSTAALVKLVGSRRAQPAPTDTTQHIGRHDPAAISARFATPEEHDRALVAHISQATDAIGITLGDIAILCDFKRDVDKARALLAAAGIQSMSLMDYTGVTVNAANVGTTNRAKGLEFKLVLLPWTPIHPCATDEERAARDLRERYVAATRARDALCVGFC